MLMLLTYEPKVTVSTSKTYHHGDLRAAAIEAGLKLLEAREADDPGLREVARAVGVTAGGGAAGFGATGRAYVRFALDNPALFRLIFSTMPAAGDPFGRPPEEAPEAFRMLRDNAALLAPPGAGPEAAKLIALEAWALVHGLATLILDGQIARDDALIDALLGAKDR
jgi:hypothetical protein